MNPFSCYFSFRCQYTILLVDLSSAHSPSSGCLGCFVSAATLTAFLHLPAKQLCYAYTPDFFHYPDEKVLDVTRASVLLVEPPFLDMTIPSYTNPFSGSRKNQECECP